MLGTSSLSAALPEIHKDGNGTSVVSHPSSLGDVQPTDTIDDVVAVLINNADAADKGEGEKFYIFYVRGDRVTLMFSVCVRAHPCV